MSRAPSSPISVWRPIRTGTFLLGAPHYPEHVDESCWERDAERMAAAGFNATRMGEFAWHIFEPREGEFDFALFDKAIEVLGRQGIKTIMCTPTATPPRWLTANYPEVLRVDGNGRPASHGSRQHADTCSPVYRLHSKRITAAMAEHYKSNPFVIGWQTDNELNTTESRSYSPATRGEFQAFLEARYGSIEELNRVWGGDFWATAYDEFDQIVLPFDHAPGVAGPGHVLDYHRFLAFATARFQADQVEILHTANPDWFIFHDVGRPEDIDFRGRFSRDVDFLGFNNYPLLYDEMQRQGGHALAQAYHLDVARGSTGNFIVPEQQSGLGSQPDFATLTPEPGEMRRMAISSVARGADGVMFFRWRPAHFGAEIYWMGIIDHDDIPRRRYDEVRQFASEINAIKDKILGTHVRMDVGIAGSDFDNQEAHRTYPMGLPSPEDDGMVLYRYCYRQGIACGFIHPEDDLSPLKVLYVPHWLIWKPEWTDRIRAFAQGGGTAILGARTATRDENNHVIRETAPGSGLSRLAGVTVEEFGRLAPVEGDGLFPAQERERPSSDRLRYATEVVATQVHVHLWQPRNHRGASVRLLKPAEGTEVIGTWSNRFASGEAAITARHVGKGSVVYVGTYLTEDFVANFAPSIISRSGVAPLLPELPQGVEVTVRQAVDRQLLFVLNTRDQPVSVRGVPEGSDLLTGAVIKGNTVDLEGYGCSIVEMRSNV